MRLLSAEFERIDFLTNHITYDTMPLRGLVSMSMIICLCGLNFCSMVSDGRKIDMADGSVLSEDEKKIFKLNDRVLFGAAGIFRGDEKILDAVSSVPNLATASAKIIKNAVLSYLKENRESLPRRSYIIGEKVKDGDSRIYEITFDPAIKKPQVVLREPNRINNFALSVAVPPGLNEQVILRDVGQMVTRCVQHKQAMDVMQAAIVKASKLDESVNSNTFVESIF